MDLKKKLKNESEYLLKLSLSLVAVFTIALVSVLANWAVDPAERMAAQPPGTPVVNGLFYCDGDYNNYYLLNENIDGRAAVYYRIVGDVLYTAMVVNASAWDNVFGYKGPKACKVGEPGTDEEYQKSAGWCFAGPAHSFTDNYNSDHMEIEITCAGVTSWHWSQDFLEDADLDIDPREADFFSDHTGSDGSGTPPPGIDSTSSMVWNMNHHAPLIYGTNWDVTGGGIRPIRDWKSPDELPYGIPGTDKNVNTNGYPTCDTTWEWEWQHVYELSINASQCGGSPVSIDIINTHGSPNKDGLGPDINISQTYLIDWGDAPDPNYPTLNASNGAYHYIVPGGPILGVSVDSDLDGQPNAGATGDDNDGNDDEDGVATTSLYWGQQASVQVTGTAGSKLDAWIDFNGDGDWDDPGEQIATSYVLTGGSDVITFPMPEDYSCGGPLITAFARFRVSTAGGLSPTGPADNGEVEDYQIVIQDPPLSTLSLTARVLALIDELLSHFVTEGEGLTQKGVDLSGALSSILRLGSIFFAQFLAALDEFINDT